MSTRRINHAEKHAQVGARVNAATLCPLLSRLSRESLRTAAGLKPLHLKFPPGPADALSGLCPGLLPVNPQGTSPLHADVSSSDAFRPFYNRWEDSAPSSTPVDRANLPVERGASCFNMASSATGDFEEQRAHVTSAAARWCRVRSVFACGKDGAVIWETHGGAGGRKRGDFNTLPCKKLSRTNHRLQCRTTPRADSALQTQHRHRALPGGDTDTAEMSEEVKEKATGKSPHRKKKGKKVKVCEREREKETLELSRCVHGSHYDNQRHPGRKWENQSGAVERVVLGGVRQVTLHQGVVPAGMPGAQQFMSVELAALLQGSSFPWRSTWPGQPEDSYEPLIVWPGCALGAALQEVSGLRRNVNR
ncbi:hypothetical protein EYF80_004848 [Liparis tanakae]|uniref:Uncharacterized protein n=1 Tax=Liparis tanakae TaxID=230148 RepID=A0A4Z2J5K3_9TELE|nr:hypothetical protein EYF80_004848 [Liparis tanakae]